MNRISLNLFEYFVEKIMKGKHKKVFFFIYVSNILPTYPFIFLPFFAVEARRRYTVPRPPLYHYTNILNSNDVGDFI